MAHLLCTTLVFSLFCFVSTLVAIDAQPHLQFTHYLLNAAWKWTATSPWTKCGAPITHVAIVVHWLKPFHACQSRSHSTMWRHPVIKFWELGYVDQNFLNENFDISNKIATSWTNTTCSKTRLSCACARCWWESSSNTEHANNHMFRSRKFARSVPRPLLTLISNSGWSAKQDEGSAREEWNQNLV